jgi:signal transduction histidine kinase
LLSLAIHRLLLGLFAPPRVALQFNALVILLAAPTFIALAFLARNNAAPGLRAIRTIYSLQGASLLFSMLPFLGWISATEWSLHATLLNGFISAFLMFLLLHLRARKLAREASMAAVDLEVTREQLALKSLQKQQQERFMAMLTHALKTPIAVVRMALGKLQLSDPVQRRPRQPYFDSCTRCRTRRRARCARGRSQPGRSGRPARCNGD